MDTWCKLTYIRRKYERLMYVQFRSSVKLVPYNYNTKYEVPNITIDMPYENLDASNYQGNNFAVKDTLKAHFW